MDYIAFLAQEGRLLPVTPDGLIVCLFCCFTFQVNSYMYGHMGRSVHINTLFPGQA